MMHPEKWRAMLDAQAVLEARLTSKASWLVFMIEAGALIIAVPALYMHWILSITSLAPWVIWELAALAWTILLCLYYYFCVTRELAKNMLLSKVTILVLVSLVPIVATSVLYNKVAGYHEQAHIWLVAAIAVAFLVADCLLARAYEDESRKKEFYESVVLADLPIVGAFAWMVSYQHMNDYITNLDVFLGGAISFQLITSHAIFIAIQAGMPRKMWEAVGR